MPVNAEPPRNLTTRLDPSSQPPILSPITQYSISPGKSFQNNTNYDRTNGLNNKMTSSNNSNADPDGNNLETLVATESQLILLCLDHLRDLRRSYSIHSDDLELAEGINGDYITIAIWALSRCFIQPKELTRGIDDCNNRNHNSYHKSSGRDDLVSAPSDQEMYIERPQEYGNDAHFHPEVFPDLTNIYKKHPPFQLSENIFVPSLKLMEKEFLYQDNKPSRSNNNGNGLVGCNVRKNKKRIHEKENLDSHDDSVYVDDDDEQCDDPGSWYEYDDAHYSNKHRFYPLDGLSSVPLTLSEIVVCGLSSLTARSRGDAESEMVQDELFKQFVDAVTSKGFFNISDDDIGMAITNNNNSTTEEEEQKKEAKAKEIYDWRFRKVVGKFRSKLAAKAEADQATLASVERENRDSKKEQLKHKCEHQQQEQWQETKILPSSHNKKNDKISRHRPEEDTIVDDSIFGADESTIKTRDNNPSPNHHQQKRVEEETQIDPHDEIHSYEDNRNHDDHSIRTYSSGNPTVLSLTSSAVHKVDLEEAERLKARGNAFMQKKNYAQAAECYTSSLELVPAGPTSHVYFSNRAAALLSMKNFQEAIWDSERSLALKPDYCKAHARLGLAYFMLGNYKDAMDAYTLAVKYEPENKTNIGYLEKSRKRYLLAKSRQYEDESRAGGKFDVLSSVSSRHHDKNADSSRPRNSKSRQYEDESQAEGQFDVVSPVPSPHHGQNEDSSRRHNSKSRQYEDESRAGGQFDIISSVPSHHSDKNVDSSRPRNSKSRQYDDKSRAGGKFDGISSVPSYHSDKNADSSRPHNPNSRQYEDESRTEGRFDVISPVPSNRYDKNTDSSRSHNSNSRQYEDESRAGGQFDGISSVSSHRYDKNVDSSRPHKIRNMSRNKTVSQPKARDTSRIRNNTSSPSSSAKGKNKSRSKPNRDRRNNHEEVEIVRSNSHLSFHEREEIEESPIDRKSYMEQKEADRLKVEGNKYMARKDYENAIQSYTAALRLSPAGPWSHVYFSNRAAALCYLERYEDAEVDSERSLALEPEYGKAHARLGLSRFFLGNYEGAAKAYEAALQYDPNNAASKSYLAKARSKIEKSRRQQTEQKEKKWKRDDKDYRVGTTSGERGSSSRGRHIQSNRSFDKEGFNDNSNMDASQYSGRQTPSRMKESRSRSSSRIRM